VRRRRERVGKSTKKEEERGVGKYKRKDGREGWDEGEGREEKRGR
jgi:hypothetical protein